MKTIKTIEDIKFSLFKDHQDVFFQYDKADTKAIYDAFQSVYEASDETMSKITPTEVFAYMRNINAIINADDNSLITKFKSNGITYGFIPNFNEITAGELIDLDTLLKQQNWYGIASILYRPIVSEDKAGRYEIEPYKAYDDKIFSEANIKFYYGFITFFYKSYQILNQSIRTSTTK